MAKSKRNCLLGLVISGLAAICVVIFALLGPSYFFRKPESLKIGFLLGENDLGKRLLDSAKRAIDDIHKSVKEMDPYQVKPPLIEFSVGAGKDNAQSFETLYEEGVRIFFGLDDADVLEVAALAATKADNCSIISPSATTSLIPTGGHVALLNFDDETLAMAYLKLIDNSNPTGKVMYVIPVVRTEEIPLTFFERLVHHVKDFDNLRLTSPVLYEPSLYPKSDALQIVSDIGSRLGLVPNAQIMFVSSQELRFVIETAHVNRALGRRRWFAKDLDLMEEPLLRGAEESLRQFCRDVSLTTLSYLADGDGDWDEELSARAFAGLEETPARLSLFAEAAAYKSIMLVHRAFTKSQYLGLAGGLFESWSSEGPFSNLRRTAGVLLANVFIGGRVDEVVSVPNTGWLAEREVRINATDISVSAIRSHPLYKKEMVRLSHLSSKRRCELDEVTVELPKSVYTPTTTYSLNVSLLPDMILFPVKKGIRISFSCSSSDSSGDESLVSYVCLPNKFDSGNLTCMTAVLGETLSRPKRSSNKTVEKKQVEESNTLVRVMGDVFDKTFPVWQAMLPNIFSCTSSVVGCDFCFYFLSTYNVSAYPASCVGGCSLGMFGSCSSLIGVSLQHSFKMLT